MLWISRPLDNGRYDQALKRCRFLLRWRSADSRLHAFQGTVLLMAGRAGEAEQELLLSIAGGHSQATTLWSLGSALVALGRKPEGAKMYRRSLELDPKLMPALGDLAALELDCGNFEVARDVLHRALKLAGDERGLGRQNARDYIYMHTSWARVLAGSKRFAEASATLDKVTRETPRVKSKPSRAGAWWRIGQAHLSLRNQAQALLAFENACQVDPDGYYGHLAADAIREWANPPAAFSSV